MLRLFRLSIAMALTGVVGVASCAEPNTKLPVDFGIVVYPAFEALDAFGPLEVFNLAAVQSLHINLHVIAATLEPVTTKPQSPAMNRTGANFGESIVPTHTFAAPPEKLDVLLVPGGLGTRDLASTQPVVDFIARTYPRLQYLVTGCTGTTLVARTGHLDGRRATGNKRAWDFVKAQGPKVDWVGKARWVVDGNIWSSSGVSAFIDVTIAFVASVFGEELAQATSDRMEYIRNKDADNDPFAALYNVTDARP